MGNKKFNNKHLSEKCFICDNNFRYLFTHFDSYLKTSNKKFDIYKCTNCGLLKIFPEPTSQEIQNFYPREYYSFNSANNSKLLEKIKYEILGIHYKVKRKSLSMRLLAHIFINSIHAVPLYYPKYNAKFLDIGCGDGYWIDMLEKYGWNCTGVELIGQEHDKIRIGNFLEMNFDEKYEFIRMSHVLEHVLNSEEYLFKIKSLLCDGGECHISLPNTNSACFKIFGKYWFALDVPRHLHGFNNKNLKIMMRRAGLKIKSTCYNSRGGFGDGIRNFLNIQFGWHITDRFFIFTILSLMVDKIFDFLKLGDSITIIVEKG